MKKRKVFLFSLMALLILGFTFTPITASANEIETGVMTESDYSFVVDSIEKYYRNKDLGAANDISSYFSEELQMLLEAKIEMDSYQRQTYDLTYRDYQISIMPFDEDAWYKVNSETFLTLQVVRTWYYNSEQTTMSEVLNVVMCNDGTSCLITSCYDKCESITYGPIDELFQNALNTQNARSTYDIDTLLNDYITDFKVQCDEKAAEMNETLQNSSTIDKEISPLSSTSLSRTDIKNWARSNYDQTTPTSAISVSYYDFSQIDGAYDCTNFVSHALAAGGATLHDNGSSGITGTDQWYYRSTSNRSSSWAGVNQLYSFLTRSNPSDSNIGPYATEKTLTYANAYTGDIVQGHNGTTWRHSTIVTKFENSQVYVTGRTSPGVYNDNQLATTIYGTQRLLHLEGNYSGQ